MLELLAAEPAWLVSAVSVVGLLVGSFLNVVILRLPPRILHDWRAQGREALDLPEAPPDADPAPPNLVTRASHCPQCKHAIAPYDNVPLLSWLVLRGKCRHCGGRISAQYPIVEATTAILSALCAWRFGFGAELAVALVVTWMLIALTGIDLMTYLLPDQLTLPMLWIALLASTVPVFVGPADAILGAAAGYLVLWSVYWLFKLVTGKEGMGYGDFKLLAALGALTGPAGIVPMLILSSLVGAVAGSAWIIARGKDRATPIPFGPYLAAAGFIQLLWGRELLEKWLGLYSP